MIEPMTQEEFEKEITELLARLRSRARRRGRQRAKPLDMEKFMAECPGELYEGFEDDVIRMRRGQSPIGPRK